MKKIILVFVLTVISFGIGIYLKNIRDKQVNYDPHPFEQISMTDQKIEKYYQKRQILGDGYYRAFMHSKKNADNTLDLSTQDSWESIGPTNQGGRTISLKIDPNNPNIVYAGAASGGLWRFTSTGNGSNDYFWEKIETGYPVLGVGAIAIDPRDSDIIYIGTGEAHMHRVYAVPLGRFMFTYGIGI